MNSATISPTSLPPGAVTICAAMIRHFEGLRLLPYWDSYGGVWSIGYGFCTLSDGSAVTGRTPALSLAECETLLEAKLRSTYLRQTAAYLQGIALTDGQFAALGSFAWNEGPGRIASAGLPGLLRQGNFLSAAAVLRRYTIAGGAVLPGLVTRRAQEGAMLMGATWPFVEPHAEDAHPPAAARVTGPTVAAARVPVVAGDDGADAANAAELARLGLR